MEYVTKSLMDSEKWCAFFVAEMKVIPRAGKVQPIAWWRFAYQAYKCKKTGSKATPPFKMFWVNGILIFWDMDAPPIQPSSFLRQDKPLCIFLSIFEIVPGLPLKHRISSSCISLIAITMRIPRGATFASRVLWFIATLIRLHAVNNRLQNSW